MTDKDEKNKNLKSELVTITKGAGFSFFGSIFGKITSVIITPIITRILGATLYGIYSLGITILSFSSKVANLGLDKGALKYIAAFRSKNDKGSIKGTIIITSIISFISGTVCAVLLFLFSTKISLLFNKAQLVTPLKYFALVLPFLVLLTTLSNITRGFKTTKYSVIARNIVSNIVRIILILFFWVLGYKLIGVIWAYIIGVIIAVIFLIYYIKKLFPEINLKKVKTKFQTKKIILTSAPLMFVGILGFLLSWTDMLMVGFFLPSSQVGIYKISTTVAALVSISLSIFMSIFLPVISEYYHQKKLKSLDKILKTIAKWVLILSIPVFLIILTSSKEILRIFGPDFTKGNTPLVILAFANIFNVLTFGVKACLEMSSKQKLSATLSAIAVILNIILNYILIVNYNLGITGAAIATTISLFLVNILGLIFNYTKLNLSPISLQSMLILLFAALTGLISSFVKNNLLNNMHFLVNLLLTSITIIVIFGLIIWKFINKNDKFILIKIKHKLNI